MAPMSESAPQRAGHVSRVKVGTLEELKMAGRLTGKVGSRPVCVFWDDGAAYAVEDRCPHMGFPLHRGTVESGLLTCHWHHARFDLASGGTLDPFADDVDRLPGRTRRGRGLRDRRAARRRDATISVRRLEEGLEQGITLVIAKAVIGLLERRSRAEGDRRDRRRASAPATGDPVGAPGSRCSSRCPTSSGSSTRPTGPSRSYTAWSFVSDDTRGRPAAVRARAAVVRP